MTLVASWINLERGIQPSIWTVADTKIIDGDLTLTLEGSKVFELQVVCKNLSHSWGEVYYQTSLGFAYAGSSLIGLNTYATLNTLLSNLGGGDKNHLLLPDHESILSKAKDILKVYAISIQGNVEITIWGFCPKSKLPFIGTVRRVKVGSEISYPTTIEHGYSSELRCTLLGSHCPEVLQEIAQRAASCTDKTSHEYWRTPIMILREIIDQNRYHEIGGNIQLAMLSVSGSFRHYAVVVPVKGLEPVQHTILYRNIDQFEHIGQSLGECAIAIGALHLDLPNLPSFPSQS